MGRLGLVMTLESNEIWVLPKQNLTATSVVSIFDTIALNLFEGDETIGLGWSFISCAECDTKWIYDISIFEKENGTIIR